MTPSAASCVPCGGKPDRTFAFPLLMTLLGLPFHILIVAAEGDGIALCRPFSVTDLNGDGRPDILTPSKHFFWILLNEGYREESGEHTTFSALALTSMEQCVYPADLPASEVTGTITRRTRSP